MKAILIFLAIGTASAMMLFKDVTPGDPIPGCDVKVGRKPPGGNALFSTVTDTSGNFEFNGLEAGNGYYVEFDLAALGIATDSMETVIEGLAIEVSNATATEAKQKATEAKQKAEQKATEAKQKAEQKAKNDQKDTRGKGDKMQSANKNRTATITKIFGTVEATVTVDGNSIRGTLRYATN